MAITQSLLKLFFGSKADKDRKAIEPYVQSVLKVYPQIEKLSHDELRDRVQSLKAQIADAIAPIEEKINNLATEMEDESIPVGEKEKIATTRDKLKKDVNERIEEVLLEIMPEVFAIVKDTARRFTQNDSIEVTATQADRDLAAERDFVNIVDDKAVYTTEWTAGGNTIKWDMIHYDVQLFGGVALHKGNVAEMATGEGKTLVATLPVFLNALCGKGVHIVTVNDYLSKRDSEWMGPLYQFHGLSVDCIDRHRPGSEQRRKAYQADITFGTNNEFGFDYLRDNMATKSDDLVQRPHHFAIVDEVDSVLIDDARTPLIISGPVPKGEDQLFEEYNPMIQTLYGLQKNLCTKLLVEAKSLIAAGNTKEGGILLYRSHKGLPKSKALIKYLSEDGIKSLMLKTENAYMENNMKRMHEITDDLFFVIQERQRSVELTDKGHEALSKSTGDKNFFVLPNIGEEIATLQKSELDETQRAESKDKLLADYAVKSERVHTVNQLLKAYAMFEKDTEYILDGNKVKIVDEQTGRVMEGRRYSDGLHQAIEAKEHVKVEAATQTFATVTLQNYFRMYHKLAGMTGTAETEASELWNIYKLDVIVIPTNRKIARFDRNDIIYKTKREKYAAVIEEAMKMVQEGRPVLIGTTSVEISEFISRSLKLRGIKHNVLNAKQHQSEAMIVAEAGRAGQVTIATNMAGRGTDIKLSAEVKAAGGLAIIGTERHESRRVDRQLRGRAGRQGDPGSSQFFVSLEDDLMRLFGSERISKLMDRMGIKEGESIQAGMMTSAIERAQKKVEENNFGMRKRLIEYDDVMNSQREVIYGRRRHALSGERIDLDLNLMMGEFAINFVENFRSGKLDEFKVEFISQTSVEPILTDKEFSDMSDTELSDRLVENITAAHARRSETIARVAMPLLRKIYEEQGDHYERIIIPITDGLKGYNVPVNLKKAIENDGAEIMRQYTRIIMLLTIDEKWKEHLREMDDLKQSVQNASYEQKDPLLIYKFESFNLFTTMVSDINRDTISTLLKATIPVQRREAPQQGAQGAPQQQQPQQQPAQPVIPPRAAPTVQSTDMSRMQTSRHEAAMNAGRGERQKPSPVHVEKQVGRNEPCPCGSGKKYKNCHGK